MVYKQWKLISHSAGGWKSKVMVPERVKRGSFSRLQTSPCVLTRQRERGSSLVSPQKGTNPLSDCCTLVAQSLLNGPPKTITLEIRFSTCELRRDTDIHLRAEHISTNVKRGVRQDDLKAH